MYISTYTNRIYSFGNLCPWQCEILEKYKCVSDTWKASIALMLADMLVLPGWSILVSIWGASLDGDRRGHRQQSSLLKKLDSICIYILSSRLSTCSATLEVCFHQSWLGRESLNYTSPPPIQNSAWLWNSQSLDISFQFHWSPRAQMWPNEESRSCADQQWSYWPTCYNFWCQSSQVIVPGHLICSAKFIRRLSVADGWLLTLDTHLSTTPLRTMSVASIVPKRGTGLTPSLRILQKILSLNNTHYNEFN